MTDREAMTMALEALEGNCTNPLADSEQAALEDKAITALRAALALPDRTGSQHCERMCEAEAFKIEIRRLKAALAQEEPWVKTYAGGKPNYTMAQEEQEPVAHLWQHTETGRTRIIELDQVWTASDQWKHVGPLHIAPPQRKQEEQEPVAWAVFEGENAHDLYLPQEYDEALKMAGYKGSHAEVKPLYTAPPRRKQEEQEPYAWMAVGGTIWRHKGSEDDVPLYTAPPRRKPLTDEKIRDGLNQITSEDTCGWSFRRGVAFAERAHGIGGQDE